MGRFVGHRQEVVLRCGGQVQNLAAGHDVVVHVDWVDRVGNENRVVLAEQIQQVAQIAFGTVRNEDFRHIQRNAVTGVIVLDGAAQELIALLAGDIAVEGALVALLLDGFVHGLGHRRRQR